MTDWVADTSVVVKWVVAEPDSPLALKVTADVSAAGGRLDVLDLAFVEATNVLWTRHRRGLLTLSEAQRALALLNQTAVQIVPCLPLLTVAFDLAVKHGVAVYDALFVAASDNLGAGGVTADEPLVRAVGSTYPNVKALRHW
jgi:predicted nucleic acid-binding protein